jgi:uncharacterized protein (TIGR03083 family)
MHASEGTGSGTTDTAISGRALYRDGRERFVALGRSLTEQQGALVVPATPQWTVKDNFAHMAGVADDLLNGRIEGAATDPWTAAQVDTRRHRSLAAVLDEWERLGPPVDALLGTLGDSIDPRLFLDQWTHEQDVRGAVGVPGGSDAPVVRWGVPLVIAGWVRAIGRAGLPAISIRCDGREWVAGEVGDGPTRSLTLDGYTALRVTVGRRSERQLAALDWRGVDDPRPYYGCLVVFRIAADDVVDLR